MRWLDVAPLLIALQRRRPGQTVEAVAVAAGVDRRTVDRLQHRTRVKAELADRLAVALGAHPCEIWPNWFPEG